jgi:hypothetical protein
VGIGGGDYYRSSRVGIGGGDYHVSLVGWVLVEGTTMSV